MKINRFALLTLLTFIGAAPAFPAGATFTATGVIDMLPTSMSDDGSIVVGVGTFGAPNLYYTEAGGAVVIGDGCASGQPAISGDGTTIVGCNVDAQGKWNAAKWLGGTSWFDLGTVDGGVSCDAFLSGSYGINQDGSLAVGLLYLPQICKASAGTWDLSNNGEASILPNMFGNDKTYTRANAVNDDGSVIVGWQDQLTGLRTAAKWVNGVEELILTDSGELNGEALAVSADGKTIVGIGYALSRLAWVWREGEGVSPLGGGKQGTRRGTYEAFGVSDDGHVIVGLIHGGRGKQKAFLWRNQKGVFLDTFITNQGAVIPDGWTLSSSSVISADGKTIYGWGFNPGGHVEMFKVVLN